VVATTKSFKALKKRFMMKPILVVPDLDKKMRMEVNTSDYATVRVLSIVRNRPATEPVMLKVYNVKLSFDIWLVLYVYFILYF